MKKIFIMVFCVTLLFSNEVKKLNLEDAIKIALKNNKSQKISKLALELAQAQYKQALSLNYPILKAIFVGQRTKEDAIFEQRGSLKLPAAFTKTLALAKTIDIADPNIREASQKAIRTMPESSFPETNVAVDMSVIAKGRDTIKGSLNLEYPIFTGGKITSIINQARLNKLIALNGIKRNESQVVFDTKKYFYAYVITNEVYKLLNSFHSRMKNIEKLTKDFYQSGDSLSIKKTDYLSIKVIVALIKSLVSKVQTNKTLLQSAFINVLGLPWDSQINLVYKKKLLPLNYTLAQLVEKAYKDNLDIKKLDIALNISKEQIDEKKAGHYPSLALFANVSKTYNSYKYGILNEDQNNSWDIGFAANIPIFDGFRTTNEINEKKIEKKKMYLLRDMIKEGLALQIKNELTKAYEGFKQIKALKEAKKVAKDSRILNSKGYAIGMIEPRDVLQSEYLEMYVRIDYLRSIHDYLLSLAKIDSLVAQGLK